MGAQFNLDYYNRVEANKVKQIPRLKERLRNARKGWRTCCEFPEDQHAQLHAVLEKESDLRAKIDELNPLHNLETCVDEAYSSVPRYEGGTAYERKIPLDETDAELIRIVKDNLPLKDWQFLQVRTEEMRDGEILNYVLAFQYIGDKNPYDFSKKQTNDNWRNPDFSEGFVEELGLSNLGDQLPEDLTDKYKFQNLRVTPGYENGSQGKAPYFPDFRFLFIKLELENREMKQARLNEIADSLYTKAVQAKEVAESYRG